MTNWKKRALEAEAALAERDTLKRELAKARKLLAAHACRINYEAGGRCGRSRPACDVFLARPEPKP